MKCDLFAVKLALTAPSERKFDKKLKNGILTREVDLGPAIALGTLADDAAGSERPSGAMAGPKPWINLAKKNSIFTRFD